MASDPAVLKLIPLFKTLNKEELESLASLLKLVRKESGETFFRQGDMGTSLYFIQKGRVRFTFRHDTGDIDTFEAIGAGTFFGEVALFSIYGERTATAEATESTEAFELTRDDLLQFMRSTPDAALHLLGGMAERLRRSGLQLQHATVRNLNEVEDEQLTKRDRVAQGVARFAGSPGFIGLHACAFGLWFIVNAYHGEKAFDPFPFHVLALWIGIEAMLLSCFVLMNQYREDKAQTHRNNEEYKINLTAAKQTANLHFLLSEMKQDLVGIVGKNQADNHDSNTSDD